MSDDNDNLSVGSNDSNGTKRGNNFTSHSALVTEGIEKLTSELRTLQESGKVFNFLKDVVKVRDKTPREEMYKPFDLLLKMLVLNTIKLVKVLYLGGLPIVHIKQVTVAKTESEIIAEGEMTTSTVFGYIPSSRKPSSFGSSIRKMENSNRFINELTAVQVTHMEFLVSQLLSMLHQFTSSGIIYNYTCTHMPRRLEFKLGSSMIASVDTYVNGMRGLIQASTTLLHSSIFSDTADKSNCSPEVVLMVEMLCNIDGMGVDSIPDHLYFTIALLLKQYSGITSFHVNTNYLVLEEMLQMRFSQFRTPGESVNLDNGNEVDVEHKESKNSRQANSRLRNQNQRKYLGSVESGANGVESGANVADNGVESKKESRNIKGLKQRPESRHKHQRKHFNSVDSGANVADNGVESKKESGNTKGLKQRPESRPRYQRKHFDSVDSGAIKLPNSPPTEFTAYGEDTRNNSAIILTQHSNVDNMSSVKTYASQQYSQIPQYSQYPQSSSQYLQMPQQSSSQYLQMPQQYSLQYPPMSPNLHQHQHQTFGSTISDDTIARLAKQAADEIMNSSKPP
jgi:hypothetical protein